MKLSIKAGSTSESVNIFIQDSSSTVGAGLAGLAYNSSGLTAYYTFAGANATATAITLATLATVTTAYSSGGFIEIDATNMPGWYRLDIPNACVAGSKGRSVAIHLKGATNMAPLPIEIELTGWDNQDAVRGGMTAMPNANAGANGGLPLGDASGDVTFNNTSIATVTNLTNLPAITAGWLTATGIAASALDGKGDWNVGKTGYSLTQTFPTNFADLAITATTGRVTVGTNDDKTGYALTQTFPTNFADLAITATTGKVTVGTNDDKTGYTASTVSDKTGYSLAADQSAVTIGTVNASTLAATQGSYAPAKAGDAMTLTSVYDVAKGTVAMTESYAANGSAPTLVQAIYAIHQMLMDFSISGTSYTVKKLDNATTAFTVTLNDATTPTGASR